MKRLGVVIARFQCHELTAAHRHLLKKAAAACDRCIVLIGCDAIPRKREPLDYPLRERMVRDWWMTEIATEVIVMPLFNRPSDVDWARSVDQLIDAVNFGGKVTIFCGPDGAGPCYTNNGGRHGIELIESFGMHATSVRENLLPRHTEDFRAGVIYGSERRFVNPFMCVDVLVGSPDGLSLLLVQKPEDKARWRLVGGFVDIGESLENAAVREVHEETGIEIARPRYVGSAPVHDWRYREGPERILSAVFYAVALRADAPKAHDDISDATWAPRRDVIKRAYEIHPVHHELFQIALAYHESVEPETSV